MKSRNPIHLYCLEIHLTSHCNIACKGCSQNSPLMQERLQSIEKLQQNLDRLKSSISCSKLQILGGEPLLHPELLDAMRVCDASPLSENVVVKTNGLLLHKVSPEFWGLASKVIVSVYPSTKRVLEKRRELIEAAAKHQGAELEFRYWTHFNHIVKPHRTESERITNHVFANCRYKDFCVSISGDRLFRCSISVNSMHKPMAGEQPDSISITDTENLEQQVSDFLTSPTPISSCRYCFGSFGAEFKHRALKSTNCHTPVLLDDYYR